MGFYQTNIANGEFKKHIGAYILCAGIGAGFVFFDGCDRIKNVYDKHAKSMVEDVIKPYQKNYSQSFKEWYKK